MADIRIRNTIDPFGQMLEGRRTANRDFYDRALKKVQMVNTMERLRLARSAHGRAGEAHALNMLVARERLSTLRTNNEYLPEHLRNRNAIDSTRGRALGSDADLRVRQNELNTRDAEIIHGLEQDAARARIGRLNRQNQPPPPWTPRRRLRLGTPPAGGPGGGTTPPAQSPIPTPRPPQSTPPPGKRADLGNLDPLARVVYGDPAETEDGADPLTNPQLASLDADDYADDGYDDEVNSLFQA